MRGSSSFFQLILPIFVIFFNDFINEIRGQSNEVIQEIDQDSYCQIFENHTLCIHYVSIIELTIVIRSDQELIFFENVTVKLRRVY